MKYRRRPVLRLLFTLAIILTGCERSPNTASRAAPEAGSAAFDPSEETHHIGDTALAGVALARTPNTAYDAPRTGPLVTMTRDALTLSTPAEQSQPEFRLTLEDGRVDASVLEGGDGSMFIEPLYDALDAIESRLRREATVTGEDRPVKTLVLAADAKAPFRVVMQVLYTARQADFSAAQFLVEGPDGEQMRIEHELPQRKMMPDLPPETDDPTPCALPEIMIDEAGALVFLHDGRAGESVGSTILESKGRTGASDKAGSVERPPWANRALTRTDVECPVSHEKAASTEYFADALSSFEDADYCRAQSRDAARGPQPWIGGISPAEQVRFGTVAAAMTAIRASGGVFHLSMSRWPGTGFVMPGTADGTPSLATLCENAFTMPTQ